VSPFLLHELAKLSLHILDLSFKFGPLLKGLLGHLFGSEASRHDDGFRVRSGYAASLTRHGWEVVKKCVWAVFVGFVFGGWKLGQQGILSSDTKFDVY